MLMGPAQVLIRLADALFWGRMHPLGVALISAAALPLGVLALLAIGQPLMAGVAFAVLFGIVVVYRVMGRDYEAAVATAGFLGFSMGATATAIANMQAVANRYGPAPVAFLVVPLTGAFFIDLANALILTGALTLPSLKPESAFERPATVIYTLGRGSAS